MYESWKYHRLGRNRARVIPPVLLVQTNESEKCHLPEHLKVIQPVFISETYSIEVNL